MVHNTVNSSGFTLLSYRYQQDWAENLQIGLWNVAFLCCQTSSYTTLKKILVEVKASQSATSNDLIPVENLCSSNSFLWQSNLMFITTHLLKVVVEAKSSGSPHALKMWLVVRKCMLPVKYLAIREAIFISRRLILSRG